MCVVRGAAELEQMACSTCAATQLSLRWRRLGYFEQWHMLCCVWGAAARAG